VPGAGGTRDAVDAACSDDEWSGHTVRAQGDSVRRSGDSPRLHDAGEAPPPGAHRITTAVDTLLGVLAESTPAELAAAHERLDELHLHLLRLLARTPEPVASPAIRPRADGADSAGDEGWQPVLIPAAGHRAG
jgi:hypothetical protein